MQLANKRQYRASKKAGLDARQKALNLARLDAAASKDGRASMRRGPEYERFVEAGGPAMVDGPNRLTHDEIAAVFGVGRTTVTHWLAAAREDELVRQELEAWETPPEALAALDDFVAFRERYFRLPTGEPYITARCHVEWAEEMADAIERGAQKAIIAPPRHGKTEALIHECVRQIVRNPNIRIMWIGVNEDRARDAVGLVMKELEDNELLIADFCGPGKTFRPATRSGTRWTDTEFTVSTRTRRSKSATMKAFGRGGRVIGFDADVIVCDDIEDQSSVMQLAQRQKTLQWHNVDVASRKMQHTAWFDIGSRQHPEDLISFLLGNERWEVSIYQAHDDACGQPQKVPESVERGWAHFSPTDIERLREEWLAPLHVDCTLAPELRSFKFLMDQRATMTDALFEMNFLNRPRAEGMTLFERDVVERARNTQRVLGHVPPGCRLIAGLDPATKQFQGTVLWAVDIAASKRYLVDLENVQGGSTPHLRSVLSRWAERYHVRDWVIEDNIIEAVLAHDAEIQAIKSRFGLRFLPHFTSGSSKWDPTFGVTAMASVFERDEIDLPYGDADSQERVNVYISQLVNFSPLSRGAGRTRGAPDDLVMAGWFPEREIQSWLRAKKSTRAQRKFRGTKYPGASGGRAPWRKKAAV